MTPTYVIKVTAKTALKGNYLKALVAGLPFLFCCLLCALMAEQFLSLGLLAPVYILILCFSLMFLILPLFLGTLRWFWRLNNGCADAAGEVFFFFSSAEKYLRALEFVWRLFLRVVLCGLPCLFPAYIARLFSLENTYQALHLAVPEFLSVLGVVAAVLLGIGLLVLFLISLRWYLAPFLFVADETLEARQAFHTSTVIANGTANDFLQLIFSFIGWILAALLLVPLPALLPYFLMAYFVHARFAVARYRQFIAPKDSAVTY